MVPTAPLDQRDGEVMYSIYRFWIQGGAELVKAHVTLEEAREWCQREDTHGDGWFDGYQKD